MAVTLTNVKVKRAPMGVDAYYTQFQVAEDGVYPAILADYGDGDKALIVATGISSADFATNIIFKTEQFIWDDKTGSWATVPVNLLSSGSKEKRTVNNHFKVRQSDGKWESDLTEQEKYELGDPNSTDKLIGEMDFWITNVGENAVFAPLLASISKLFVDRSTPQN